MSSEVYNSKTNQQKTNQHFGSAQCKQTTNTQKTNKQQIHKQQINRITNNKQQTMKTILHKANTRGKADHGWLKSYHSFSFANYHNLERMGFGQLRVLNDDIVQPKMGFGTHPHQNMEIISIPLEGDLEHQDNMGNVTVIKEGDVPAMSAGTGIPHREYNKNKDKAVRFLQIWVFFFRANSYQPAALNRE